MAEQSDNERYKEMLTDVFLYAPIGLLYEFSDVFPDAVKRGKSQVQIAKLLGQMAAQKSKDNIETSVEELVKDAAVFFSVIGEKLDSLYEEENATPKKTTKSKAAKSSEAKPAKSKSKSLKEPFPNYDSMNSSEIKKRIGSLNKPQRAKLAKYEKQGKNRKTVISEVNRLS